MCNCIKRMSKTVGRLLAAFDFDHTIIDGNSDTKVRDLLPVDKIPEEVRRLYRSDGWTVYMRSIFKILHQNNFGKEELLREVRNIPLTSGMDELLKWLRSVDSEIIVISDSNSVFINDYLINSGIEVDRVFTNPAEFNESGCLEIEMYHLQDWCSLSTKNLCKGHILEKYIQGRKNDGVEFSFVAYIGDGTNDFCPSLKLGENDITFPRVGYSLEKKLAVTKSKEAYMLKASVFPWRTGTDVKEALQQRLDNLCKL
ncbi:hypothetical protein J437_LFUL017846 [Ladona fulva]|uniref:Pyridoxal phosphate phosphatase PHOSPHO2 n=1 Tax=Ladona fulva TaxID=123851 RepID=A0A8K0P8X1_LADFU|nr:hypothetical protein J437_LFUL017846 [Ladona fulva]